MKRIQIEVLNPKKVKPEWELLYESKNDKIEKLIEIYKENPYHARVIYKQNNETHTYTRNRVIAYTFANGDINIVRFIHRFGISVTNKMHQSEKNIQSLIYKKETGKWYSRTKSSIKLLTYGEIQTFIQQSRAWINNDNSYENILKYIENKLPFLRNLAEDKNMLSHSLPINTMITNKLFNLKSIYRHLFKVPYPVIEIILKNHPPRYDVGSFYKIWKELNKILINVENLKADFLTNEYFIDTCKFAGALGYKVNCSWSLKRLKLEHDNWSKIISRIVLANEPLYDLDIDDIYLEFSEYSGYRMLLTNHEMVHDGIDMHHCVGTYIKSVHSGNCGIYKADGHTFELVVRDEELYLVQLKGLHNKEAPTELRQEVLRAMYNFNNFKLPNLTLKPRKKHHNIWGEDMFQMPF